ncbi:MAG: copper resistance determinant CrdA [Thermodesulfovibrionales bacterium]
MARFAVVVMAVLLTLGVAYGKPMEIKKKAGDYDVQVRIDKNPPVVGENSVEIEVKDASGRNVTDARVTVEYSMPPMPGMPAMNYKEEAALKGDLYRARLNLSMSGSWNISLKIRRGDKTDTVKFNVDAKK